MSKLSHNLKQLMTATQLTTSKLANATGIQQPTLHRILSGTIAEPRSSTLVPIAQYFQLSVEDLRNADLTEWLSHKISAPIAPSAEPSGARSPFTIGGAPLSSVEGLLGPTGNPFIGNPSNVPQGGLSQFRTGGIAPGLANSHLLGPTGSTTIGGLEQYAQSPQLKLPAGSFTQFASPNSGFDGQLRGPTGPAFSAPTDLFGTPLRLELPPGGIASLPAAANFTGELNSMAERLAMMKRLGLNEKSEHTIFIELISEFAPKEHVDSILQVGPGRKRFDYLSETSAVSMVVYRSPINRNAPEHRSNDFRLLASRCAHRLWNMSLCKKLFPKHKMVLMVLADQLPANDDASRLQLEWEAEQFDIKVVFVTSPAQAAVLVRELDQIDHDDLSLDDQSPETD
jgi:transcriptional regulator with XRE-family HTH domain